MCLDFHKHFKALILQHSIKARSENAGHSPAWLAKPACCSKQPEDLKSMIQACLEEHRKAAASLDRSLMVIEALASHESAERFHARHNEDYQLAFWARRAMKGYLSNLAATDGAYSEDIWLTHIVRSKAHASASQDQLAGFSFDVAYTTSQMAAGRGAVWVGDIKPHLSREDVIYAECKRQELQQYIATAAADHSLEEAQFRRQAAGLAFMNGCKVKLFLGGKFVDRHAHAEMERLADVSLTWSGEDFHVRHIRIPSMAETL